MLKIEDTVLLVIDVQDRLYRAMFEKELLCENLVKLIKGIRVFGMPMLVTEQYPQGIGPTIPEIAPLVEKPFLPKLSFSCCDNPEFMKALKKIARKNILVCGIEAHVCVYQTTIGLLQAGYHVEVAADAVSSRAEKNRDLGLQKMKASGAGLTGVEIVLFELLSTAGSPYFKEISRIVK